MNKVILMGRLTRDPEVRYSAGENATAVARYTLAVDRRIKSDGGDNADFIRCVVFGKGAEFAEKYLRQGTKITVAGRIQTGSYIDRDGKRVYTTDVIVEEHEFAESARNGENTKCEGTSDTSKGSTNSGRNKGYVTGDDGFMNIPDGIDEELPFL